MNKHLSSFIIQKHKSIEYLEIKPLGRINLFVGENGEGSQVILHRIEKGNKKTVRYLEDDICFIVRKGISCL